MKYEVTLFERKQLLLPSINLLFAYIILVIIFGDLLCIPIYYFAMRNLAAEE